MADLLPSATCAASSRGTTEQHVEISDAYGLADVWHPVVQASAFVMFPDVHSACKGASVLRDQTAVDAVEIFDTTSLR